MHLELNFDSKISEVFSYYYNNSGISFRIDDARRFLHTPFGLERKWLNISRGFKIGAKIEFEFSIKNTQMWFQNISVVYLIRF